MIPLRYLRHVLIPLALLPFPVTAQVVKYTTADYIVTYHDAAIEEMMLYGIPASITLAQGILESDNGNSRLAREANNHFGIKCKENWTGERIYHDDDEKQECFRKYPSARDSYRDHSLFLTTRDRYAFLFKLGKTDYPGWARGLKQAGYATHPQYAELLLKIIEENKLYIYDSSGRETAQNPVTADTTVQKKPERKDTVRYVEDFLPLNPDGDDFGDVVTGGGNRKIGENNGVHFILARAGDTYATIATDFEMTPKELEDCNDQPRGHTPAPGEVVYIEQKKDAGAVEFHTVAPGETMHAISQKYAIRLKSLYRRNLMKQGTEPGAGQLLYLQKSAPVY